MEENGLSYQFQSFVSEKGWQILYQEGFVLKKAALIFIGFLKRLLITMKSPAFDYVLLHRELTPFGPPIFEWIIARIFRKKIIYDFDDAIWMGDRKESALWKVLKWRSKVSSICKWSWKVSVGNDYLADYARLYNDQVVVFPTVVDTDVHIPLPDPAYHRQSQQEIQKPEDEPITIGWTGSHSTLFYLDIILPALQELEKQMDFRFIVIANSDPQLPLRNYDFIQWSAETEVKDLEQLDIGVMPLYDDEWAQGKCGFKLIQYLALEIPALASPVGVNTQIIQHGVTGLIANNAEEWKDHLAQLIKSPQMRAELGKSGRRLIQENYSVSGQEDLFLSLFDG